MRSTRSGGMLAAWAGVVSVLDMGLFAVEDEEAEEAEEEEEEEEEEGEGEIVDGGREAHCCEDCGLVCCGL